MKRRRSSDDPVQISPLEAELMRVLWDTGATTADELRLGLPRRPALTDSSVRTLLRRLEAKGWVTHRRDGRRFLFEPAVPRARAAAIAAGRIVDSLCGGAVERLILGMVQHDILSAADFERIRRKIERASESDND